MTRLRIAAALLVVWGLAAPAFSQQPGSAPTGLTVLDAVRTTLDKHPLLQAQQREVDISRARKRQASGAFDTIWTAGVGQSTVGLPFTALEQQEARQLGLAFTDNRTTTIEYGGGASRRLRNGITLEPSGTVTRLTDRLEAPNGVAQSAISFEVVVPLAGGRGRHVVAADETAAALGVAAAALDSSQAMAERILEATTAYWRALTARSLLALALDAEARGGVLAEQVGHLVAAGRVPPAEMHQLRANLASRAADRISAQQDALEATQALGYAMGLTQADVAALPELTDALPGLPEGDAARLERLDVDALVRRALARRADYLAALQRVRAFQALVLPARDALRPRFDLRLGGGYSSLQEGLQLKRLFSNLWHVPSGPNASVSFRYSFAPARNEAAGRLGEADAKARQASSRSEDLARSIAASVVAAVAAVRHAAEAVRKAGESVGYYQAALEGEREKHKLGRSSLVDLLTVEDRLTAVLQTELRARLRCAVSIAQLRFASGTFVDPTQPHPALTRESLVTVPVQ